MHAPGPLYFSDNHLELTAYQYSTTKSAAKRSQLSLQRPLFFHVPLHYRNARITLNQEAWTTILWIITIEMDVHPFCQICFNNIGLEHIFDALVVAQPILVTKKWKLFENIKVQVIIRTKWTRLWAWTARQMRISSELQWEFWPAQIFFALTDSTFKFKRKWSFVHVLSVHLQASHLTGTSYVVEGMNNNAQALLVATNQMKSKKKNLSKVNCGLCDNTFLALWF